MKICQEETEELILRRSQVERQTPDIDVDFAWIVYFFVFVNFLLCHCHVGNGQKMMKHKETFFDLFCLLNYKLILFISGCLLKVFSTKARNYINWLELWAQTWNPTSTSRGDTRFTLRETHSPYFIAEFHGYSEPQQRHIIPKVTHWKSAMRNDLVYAVGDSVSAYSVCP